MAVRAQVANEQLPQQELPPRQQNIAEQNHVGSQAPLPSVDSLAATNYSDPASASSQGYGEGGHDSLALIRALCELSPVHTKYNAAEGGWYIEIEGVEISAKSLSDFVASPEGLAAGFGGIALAAVREKLKTPGALANLVAKAATATKPAATAKVVDTMSEVAERVAQLAKEAKQAWREAIEAATTATARGASPQTSMDKAAAAREAYLRAKDAAEAARHLASTTPRAAEVAEAARDAEWFADRAHKDFVLATESAKNAARHQGH